MSKNRRRHLRPPIISIRDVFKYYADLKVKNASAVRCLQIGANDGFVNDPIYKYIMTYKWNSILVEPQQNVFEKQLKKTYQGVNHVHLENVAIVNSKVDSLDFHVLGFTEDRWATGLATFDRKTLEKHIDAGYVDEVAARNNVKVPENKADYIRTIKVKASSTNDLLSKHQFEKLDVFCIDTEGYDFEVLKNLDWSHFQPELVLFESRHLSEKDSIDSQKFLREKGYRVYWERGDTIGIKFKYPFINTLVSRVTAMWRKL